MAIISNQRLVRPFVDQVLVVGLFEVLINLLQVKLELFVTLLFFLTLLRRFTWAMHALYLGGWSLLSELSKFRLGSFNLGQTLWLVKSEHVKFLWLLWLLDLGNIYCWLIKACLQRWFEFFRAQTLKLLVRLADEDVQLSGEFIDIKVGSHPDSLQLDRGMDV